MPKFNDILATGIIHSKPRIRYDKPEDDPARKPVMAFCNIIIIRGIRHFGAINGRVKRDMPIVMSLEPSIMASMETWDAGDLIEIKGTLSSVDIPKTIKCPDCGRTETIESTSYYINPISIIKLQKGLGPVEANDALREVSEFSNRLVISGRVVGDLDMHIVEKTNQRILNYRLASERKYRNRHDKNDNKYDFLTVKAYGKVADADNSVLKDGSKVIIDGMIQVRNFPRKHICPYCEKEYEFIQSATEVIPYSTEYVQLRPSMEELLKEKEESEDK